MYNLLDVFVSCFNNAIHLRPVRRRIMVLYLELFTELGDHCVVEIVPLSVIILSGIPYRQIRLCQIKRATTFLVTVAKEAASTHFVK